MRPRLMTVLAGAAALLGFVFATVSTYDFMAHLDRGVHGINCSFLPGMGTPDTSGSSGCHVTLMSPYSSVLREGIWGGIPVSLPGMAVFAFLLFWVVNLVLTRRQQDKRATGFLALGYAVPVMASIVMGYLSLVELDAACKLCIGTYIASGLGFAGALGLWWKAPSAHDGHGAAEGRDADIPRTQTTWISLAGAAAVGVAFVVVPTASYAATAPSFESYIGSCGTLPKSNDRSEVLLPVGPQSAPVSAIEVLDPLCPACRGFEARFEASSVSSKIRRQVLLFPLDDECNWMIDDAIHPGACAVSEAVLCSERPQQVIDWAFDNQDAIVEAARQEPEAAARMVGQKFPGLADCIGSPKAKARLNQSLRWAVDNELPVLTPQFYVEDVKLCDADTDLGLDYMLSRMVHRAQKGRLGS